MEKELIIAKIISIELNFFKNTKSIGGPASCQSKLDNFIVARTANWNLYPAPILNSYLNDLENAKSKNLNLVTIKYAYMMKYTSPNEYEKIKDLLPKISIEKEKLVNSLVLINLFWEEEIPKKYPHLIYKNRPIYSKDDSLRSVSVETYLRGEFLTYSIHTLNLIFKYYKECFDNNINLVYNNLNKLNNISKNI